MLIYPFHKIERYINEQKNHLISTDINKLIEEIFKRSRPLIDEFLPKNIDIKVSRKYYDKKIYMNNFKHYASLYGQEAAILSLIINPLNKIAIFNQTHILASWKLMNRIWTFIIALKAIDIKHSNNQYNEYINKFDEYFAWAIRSLARDKLHTALSALIHIIRFCKPNDLHYEQRKMFLDLLTIFLPMLVIYYLEEI